MKRRVVLAFLAAGMQGVAFARAASATPEQTPGKAPRQPGRKAPHRQVGKASIYARKFNGRKTADGTRFDPRSDTAASKTLPLGSTARVTNLETGDSTVVTIRDRGPHVAGRIVDLTPAAAEEIGLDRKQGLARVAVEPLTLPEKTSE